MGSKFLMKVKFGNGNSVYFKGICQLRKYLNQHKMGYFKLSKCQIFRPFTVNNIPPPKKNLKKLLNTLLNMDTGIKIRLFLNLNLRKLLQPLTY